MNKFLELVEKICMEDKRYKPDAYEFVMLGLSYTQKKLKRKTHVSGNELAEGLRDYAIDQYGPLALRVLAFWGISKTSDFGDIVFNMINKKLLSKTEKDSLSDFKEVYDFQKAFSNILQDSIKLEMAKKA